MSIHQIQTQLQLRNPSNDQDWEAIRRLCCETGASGAAIEQERWPFFSEFWIGPYQRFAPSWTYLALLNNYSVGYLTGCPDSKQFEFFKSIYFTPKLLLDLFRGRYEWNDDSRRFLRRTLGLEKAPTQAFSTQFRKTLYENYPAHLHINFDALVRGRGLGQELVQCFVAKLVQSNIKGLHVFCGAGPVSFYKRLGFIELEQINYMSRVPVYALGLSCLNSQASRQEGR